MHYHVFNNCAARPFAGFLVEMSILVVMCSKKTGEMTDGG